MGTTDDHERMVVDLQKGADFGVRMIPLMLKIRQARDAGVGMTLDAEEVKSLIEVINVLRGGPNA